MEGIIRVPVEHTGVHMPQFTVRIHHTDNGFRNFQFGDATEMVLECSSDDLVLTTKQQETVESGSVVPLLEAVYAELNIGDTVLARVYRAKGLRSLSVGDLVELRDEAGEREIWACSRFGWDVIEDALKEELG